MKEKRFLRIKEVMDILCYRSPTPIISLIQDGKLLTACPNGAGGKHSLITRESLEIYIKDITTNPDDWLDVKLTKKMLKRKILSKGINQRK